MIDYGAPPKYIGHFGFDLPEIMYYLYLPVKMRQSETRLPPNVACCNELIEACLDYADFAKPMEYDYVYLSARKGWATPDNPLNRPGWHADGFGTDDMNFVWWTGPGTRFAVQSFKAISDDHLASIGEFEAQIKPDLIVSPPEKGLYAIDPSVVHATPIIGHPGCMRQYIKVSLSKHQYNLENNSHNYLFNYFWPLHSRDLLRNDPHKAQLDFVAEPSETL